jgi:hypothetical protein
VSAHVDVDEVVDLTSVLVAVVHTAAYAELFASFGDEE